MRMRAARSRTTASSRSPAQRRRPARSICPCGAASAATVSRLDLSQFDFVTTGEILEFEAKMEHGFSKIELEGFDD
jgi:hypothetical protein